MHLSLRLWGVDGCGERRADLASPLRARQRGAPAVCTATTLPSLQQRMTPFLEPDRRFRSGGGGGGRNTLVVPGRSADTEKGGRGGRISGSNILFLVGFFFFSFFCTRICVHFRFRSALCAASLCGVHSTPRPAEKIIAKTITTLLLARRQDVGRNVKRGEEEGASRQVRTELRGTIKSHFAPSLSLSLSTGRGISLTLHRVSLDSDKETTTTTQQNASQQGQARPKKWGLTHSGRDIELIPPPLLFN